MRPAAFARAKIAALALLSQAHDIAALWDTMTTDYIAISQKQIDLLMKVAFGIYLLTGLAGVSGFRAG